MTMLSIREKREAAGLTVRELAKRLGTSAANVSRWEREPARVNLVTLDRVARVLGVKPSALIGEGGLPGGVTLTRGSGSAVIVTVPSLLPEAPALPFEEGYLSTLTEKDTSELSSMRVIDETMMPTLRPGDALLIECCEAVGRPGLYAGTLGARIHIRRALSGMEPGMLTVVTDNDDYPDFNDVPAHQFPVIGRVIWIGRALV